MRATDWEFKNRAMVFGLVFGLGFAMYALDHQTSTAVLGNWLAARFAIEEAFVDHLLFAFATLLLAVAALLRTWASSYLQADVVYAGHVKTASLVADGPYRRVRNPLYFANVLMAAGMGAMMSRAGFVVVIAAMLGFCFRLILREEFELRGSQGESYQRYREAVPRLWPSFSPRVASAGRPAKWADGFKAESWCWGFAAAVLAFAITLNNAAFFGILGASIALLWLLSALSEKRAA
jgi:protein-S-isoprenylcysteine O-methyltransferase Ste14